MKNLCFFLNFPSHYREEIVLKIQKELDADIFFGSKTFAQIKQMSFDGFTIKPVILKFHRIYQYFNWVDGTVTLLFKRYKNYLYYGEIYCLSTWMSLIVSRILNKNLYLWSHGFYGRESNSKKNIKRIFFGLAKGIFVYGAHSRRLMIEAGISESKVHVIYNSLNHQKILKARKEVSSSSIYKDYFSNTKPVLLYIGRVQKQKKLQLLIDALIYSKATFNSELNLIIIGTGNYIDYLKDYCTRQKIDNNVWFYGSCYDEKTIGQLIYNADLCVSPGEIGLTAIHSLSFGTPAITHNNFPYQGPEFEAIKPDVTGNFFIENDYISLAESINSWLQENPTKSNKLIENCMQQVDKYYNPDSQIKIFKSIIGLNK